MVNICFALSGIKDSALSDGLDLDATVKSWAQRKLAVEEVEEELELEKDAFLLRLVLALLALVLQPLRPVEFEPSRWRDSNDT
ncbi:hypothetical protein F441_07872 [Phytophthora nicotianae CJ01A1]|uniref:Uncharacterized protein n=3 Tax=Phytophthora nicotianae TaxID=4792 RepID=W2J6G0_PHYNI|nr:hypothetical protein L915_07733 [Phytophthora nicotianae]ETL41327.1 hypothetical protein L916_07662 [Phytophthora nicotianae]ETO76683.1 hypothetical protein F444_07949 [Phytophthora nicotianae P1976]ETP17782.1 hypothetical protein F441_07872 [Phytophthora nicotianae CJ01A1]